MSSPARVAIVCDSTADLTPDIRDGAGITMVPLNVHFGDQTFRDQVDLSTQQFMSRLESAPSIPTTSQPAAGVFEETFRELASSHDEIVCVLLSSHLSGTVQSAQLAAQAVAGTIRVEVVDSLNASLGCGFQVLNAAALAREGLDAATIANRLTAQREQYHVVFFVESLEYLRRSGRVRRSAAMLGSVVQLKPLLRMDEGVVVPFERTRTRRKAIDALVRFAENLSGIERITALHNSTPDDAAALFDRVSPLARAADPPRTVVFGPVLGAHVGPGAMGLAIEVAHHE